MTWRDWVAFVALAMMLMGNNMKFVDSEPLQYIGVFVVMVAAFVLAIAWPFGAVV